MPRSRDVHVMIVRATSAHTHTTDSGYLVPGASVEIRRMVLALVQDWASSAAVPLMGGPRVGATSNPRPGIRAEGAPDSSIRWAPVHSLELITLRSSRPFADWTAVRCVVALSCTLSCLVVVTHPVPPVCDQCLRRECLRLTPGRSLLLRLFVSSILRLSEDGGVAERGRGER